MRGPARGGSQRRKAPQRPVSDATLPDLGDRRPTRDEANDKPRAIVPSDSRNSASPRKTCARSPLVLGKMLSVIVRGFNA
jgi:hypothetical protein